MRTATSLLVGAILLLGTASAADTAQKGIELSDMDRKADPCTDFFEFANGAWRAANPIPASLPRWSRRWAAGESTKEQLKQLLDETAAAGQAQPGSVEQLIGDYYGACMDEATVNRLGVKPIEPLLVEIRAMKSSADVSNMIGRFHRMGIGVPFFFGGESDAHNPNDVIAKVFASGLGMPDRDYYVKTEDRFKEARAKYLAHVAAIFRLTGESDTRAKAEADTVLRMETKLAEASLDNVALRDPKATDHKTTFADLQKMTPHFPWAAYYKAANVTAGDLNVAEPKFLAEFDRQLASTPIADWKVYLQWHLANAAASSLSDPFVQEDWEFNGKFLSGAKEMKPRWKRCVESTDRQLGEALGKKYVEKYFPPEAKARMQEMVANLRLAMKETIEGLDWMSPATTSSQNVPRRIGTLL